MREGGADVKKDVRDLRDKLDALRERMDEKLEAVNAALAAITTDIAATKVWALLLYFALAAAMLGTMARGFGRV